MRGVKKIGAGADIKNQPPVPISIYNPEDHVPTLDIDTMVEDYRDSLDVAISQLLDPDCGKVIVTGSEVSGKTFFAAQMLYNSTKYLEDRGEGKLVPVRITKSDFNEFAPLVDSLEDYFQKVAGHLEIREEQLCIFTDNAEVAGKITESGSSVKTILEAPNSMLSAMHQAQIAGMTSAWSNWAIFDVADLYLKRKDLVNMTYDVQVDRLKATYRVELKKKYLVALVNEVMSICAALRFNGDDPKNPYALIIPAHLAIFTRRFIQLISKNGEPEGKDELHQAVVRTLEQCADIVEELHNHAHQMQMEEAGDSSITIRASSPEEARAIMEQQGLTMEDDSFLDELFEETSKKKDGEKLESDFKPKFRSMTAFEKALKKSIIGQDHAIDQVVDALSLPAAGMNLPNKPLRTFLFLGPTGVGKTELSLQIANNLFTEPLNVIRLDMSEYSTKGATTALFGSTPGYIGYSEDGGELTREVAKNPHSLIILDEVEKADPSTWDSFLQVLDAARMTTGSGKIVDFSKCVIVMTSNLGTQEMSAKTIGFGEAVKKSHEELKKIAKNSLKQYFKTEFINRIDEIVVFNQLDSKSARKIVEKELKSVGSLIEPRGHSLARASSDILDSLLESSEFALFGARDIQRTIQKKISVPLAKKILSSGKSAKKFKITKSGESTFEVAEA